MAVRAAGFDVFYQPQAIAFHEDDADTAASLKECLNSKNKELGLAKWHSVLEVGPATRHMCRLSE
jgi:hypothetical protein